MFAVVVSAIVFLLEYRLLRWRLSGKEVEGDRIWKNLRRFSGWTCAGCIAGAATYSALVETPFVLNLLYLESAAVKFTN